MFVHTCCFSLKVNFFVGAFHDAVWLYGLALKEATDKGVDPMDGFNFARKVIWDRTFKGGS